MIRITDRTLSCLDGSPRDRRALLRFLELLIETGPGAIEMSERAFRLLSPLPEYQSYVLRIERAGDAANYPGIAEFVCGGVSTGQDGRIRSEALLDSVDGAGGYANCAKVRVVGMDGALRGDYRRAFARLREMFAGGAGRGSPVQRRLEFCPADRFHCAAALAAEWILSRAGDSVVTSFGGIGGFAPTEELIMFLRTNGLRGADKTYDFFPEMSSLLAKITRKNVRLNKPVIGKRIFHVESSLHVDGILKQPECYEPFPPETVGLARKIVLGKQSGAASIIAKLSELGIKLGDERIPAILGRVKAEAAEKGRAVTDREFAKIVKGIDKTKQPLYILRNDTRPATNRRGGGAEPAARTVRGGGAVPRRYIVDSTLRDGEQTPGLCFSAAQKLKIAGVLDAGGVHQIEAGIPAISKTEKDAIVRIIENRKNAVISVWARLVPSDIEHAIDTRPDIIHVSVPVSDLHIEKKLRKDRGWVIRRLRECIDLIKNSGIEMSAGFEDAFRSETAFMKAAARVLLDSGVTRVRLSDTVGAACPTLCRAVVNELSTELDGRAAFGIHAHNDLGMAAANTMEAAKAGCLYADTTANGIGERAGNCDFARLVHASENVFDWGVAAAEAREMQREIGGIIRRG